jgi:hypothetical protein
MNPDEVVVHVVNRERGDVRRVVGQFEILGYCDPSPCPHVHMKRKHLKGIARRKLDLA